MSSRLFPNADPCGWMNLALADDVRPFERIVSGRRFEQRVNPIGKHHAARRQLPGPEIRHRERLLENGSLKTRLGREEIRRPLAQGDVDVVFAGRHGKSPGDAHRLVAAARAPPEKSARRGTAPVRTARVGSAESRRIARTYIKALAADSCAGGTVTVNGTNVPVCALKKSFRQPIEKSDATRPAVAASTSPTSAAPSRRLASSSRSRRRRSSLVSCPA